MKAFDVRGSELLCRSHPNRLCDREKFKSAAGRNSLPLLLEVLLLLLCLTYEFGYVLIPKGYVLMFWQRGNSPRCLCGSLRRNCRDCCLLLYSIQASRWRNKQTAPLLLCLP